MNIKYRFKQVADYYGLSIRKFEEKCNLGGGNISNIGDGGSVGADKLSKISDNCPEINIDWLLSGKGRMLKPPTSHNEASESSQQHEKKQGQSTIPYNIEIELLRQLLESREELISELRERVKILEERK
ncbi:MAG: hypothetical protein PHT07_24475 [Paludibacter sp.]|nr:hypothetical protein [Paludibacter sp.]